MKRLLWIGRAWWLGCGIYGQASGNGNGTSLLPEETVGDTAVAADGSLRGIWRLESIESGDNGKLQQDNLPYFKFFGDSVYLSVIYKKEREMGWDLQFQGSCGMYRRISDMALCEGESESHIEQDADDFFSLTWWGRSKDGERVKNVEGWRKQEAGVDALPQFLKKVLRPETATRFTGVWKLKSMRRLPNGKMMEAPYSSYKVYGNGAFFVVQPRVRDGLSQEVAGHVGSFEIVSDSVFSEKGGENPYQWVDDNHFKMEWNAGESDVEELWERAELPLELKNVTDMLEALAREK